MRKYAKNTWLQERRYFDKLTNKRIIIYYPKAELNPVLVLRI